MWWQTPEKSKIGLDQFSKVLSANSNLKPKGQQSIHISVKISRYFQKTLSYTRAHTHTHTHIYIYIYIHIHMCTYV